MEFSKFEDGSIVAYGVDDDGEALYEDYAIYSIEAEFEKSTIGIYCAKLVIDVIFLLTVFCSSSPYSNFSNKQPSKDWTGMFV